MSYLFLLYRKVNHLYVYVYPICFFRCFFHLGHHRTFLQILNQGVLFLIVYKSICSFLLDTYLLKVWNEAFYKI